MPSVDVAMARSLRGSVWEVLSETVVRSIAVGLQRRDILQDTEKKAHDFKTAISSWDNCMAASFCKWPLIAIIIVGGLIILGIVTCIVRCACCGVACCCSCCQCLKCCGNCCGCCDPPGGRKQKYLDAPYNPEQGYKTQAPMQAPFPAQNAYATPAMPAAPIAPAPPQYAEFDVSRKGGEDSLPAMPSWEESATKKVLIHEEEVELEQLKKPNTDPTLPLMAGASSSVPTSPMPMEHPTAYGPPQPTGPRGYAPPQAEPTIPFTHLDGQGQGPAYGQDQGFNAVPPVGAMGAMRSQSPAQNFRGYGQDPMNQSYNQMPGPAGPYRSQSPFGQGPRGASPDPYGMQRRGPMERQSPLGGPAPYGSPRQSPAPQHGRGYGPPAPAPGPGSYNAPRDDFNQTYSPGPGNVPRDDFNRTYSPGPGNAPRGDFNRTYSPGPANMPRDNFNRTYSPGPGPDRQYGNPSPRPLANTRPAPERPFVESPPASPITNNSGFDFTSGYSRPQAYDRRPSESREPAGQEGYPGYKPYNKPQDAWTGI